MLKIVPDTERLIRRVYVYRKRDKSVLIFVVKLGNDVLLLYVLMQGVVPVEMIECLTLTDFNAMRA